ncbi:unnamed protein product [Nippostrongylus brasiliensis]|uniref:Cation_ATPase_N domain-containing protein n=1 Tax=Nippostrongylus brasiliensis TaxID=27835 RepID=A0A0N4YDE2_NIPBR|nr:unnamed protein product [Nippostrongylus brasiliensis]
MDTDRPLPGAEAKEKIDADYGGITGLCERLKTDPNNGIPNSTTELERRRAVFGANEIPPHPPKCFLQLVWEALQLMMIRDHFVNASFTERRFIEPEKGRDREKGYHIQEHSNPFTL